MRRGIVIGVVVLGVLTSFWFFLSAEEKPFWKAEEVFPEFSQQIKEVNVQLKKLEDDMGKYHRQTINKLEEIILLQEKMEEELRKIKIRASH